MGLFFARLKKRLRRWGRRFPLTKRQQFVAITGILTIGLVMTQIASSDLRYVMVAAISVLAYFLTAFALREDLRGIEWLTLMSLPTLFTAAIVLFYFLLPERWLTRIPVAALYAVGMYALLLTENIYNVAADRTIALLRAAHSVGFLLTLVTYFLLVQTVLAFRLSFFVTPFLIGVVSFLLIFQSLWATELEEQVSRRVVHLSVGITLATIQIAWIFSFWPVESTMRALFLTTALYSMVGMAQQYVVEKLYKKTVIEFFVVSCVVFAIVFAAARWRGLL